MPVTSGAECRDFAGVGFGMKETGSGMGQNRPSVVATRRRPEVVETCMSELFDVEFRENDRPMMRDELAVAMRRVEIPAPTITDNLDAPLPEQADGRLKLIANYGAGADHIDVRPRGGEASWFRIRPRS